MGDMADDLFIEELIFQERIENYIYDCFERNEWPSQSGPIKVSNMTDIHIENAISYMKRNPDMPHTEMGGVKFLEKELKRRTG